MCPFTLHHTSAGSFAAVYCSAVLFSPSLRLWNAEKDGLSASPWLTGPNFSLNLGALLLHACTIIRLCAYMMSQNRKTSTGVELKFGRGDPPLVGYCVVVDILLKGCLG